MNLLKCCWRKRWLRRLAWALVVFVALCFLFCAWVNWSGARQWHATQVMLKAQGETLDFRATAKEPIPESENFCAIPLLKDLALVVDGDVNKGEPGEKRKRLNALKLPPKSKAGANPRQANPALGKPADLKQWAEWLRKEGFSGMPADSGDAARDVLAALAKHDALINELAASISRTGAQWTPEWKTRELPPLLPMIALPHYTVVQGLSGTLGLRASAALRTGDTAKAHESALILARISLASVNDPFLIGLLVGISGAARLHGTVWELCMEHAGTAEDFAKLETALVALDFRRATLSAFRSEMAAMVNTVRVFKTGRAIHWYPSGFFDAGAARVAELEFRHVIKPLKEAGWHEAIASDAALDAEFSAMRQKFWTRPTHVIAELVLPVWSSALAKAAYSDALQNQAIIACALERHRIQNASYPDSLNAVRLVDGKPLPPDPMDGKPMRYRKTADGRYALWSIGIDGKDDGGKRTLDQKKPEDTDFHKAVYIGDWVWDFPAQ